MNTDLTGSRAKQVAAGVAVVFGLLTILSGGRALLGGPAAQAAAGDAVPFVLWFNFLSGFVYVLAGIGLARRKSWGGTLATGLAIAIAFGVSYALTGDVAIAGAITLVEPLVNSVAHYFFDRWWARRERRPERCAR